MSIFLVVLAIVTSWFYNLLSSFASQELNLLSDVVVSLCTIAHLNTKFHKEKAKNSGKSIIHCYDSIVFIFIINHTKPGLVLLKAFSQGKYTTLIKQPHFENFSKSLPIDKMKISSTDSDLAPKLLSGYMFSNC